MDDETDPRLADFVALNDPARRREVERSGGYFVVEGVLAVERLLALAQWEVRSIALLPRLADRLAAAIEERFGVPPGAPGCPIENKNSKEIRNAALSLEGCHRPSAIRDRG